MYWIQFKKHLYIDGLVQDCNISSVSAMKILRSFTKTSIYMYLLYVNDLMQKET